jgi:hypothetical protein
MLARRTVSKPTLIKSGENSYLVMAFENGLLVKDRLSGVEEKLIIKRR